MSYDDDSLYDERMQADAPEYENDCLECGCPCDGEFCLDCEGADPWDNYTDDEYLYEFADPGGRSALRAATPNNPRNLPCPNCGEPDVLTPADRERGYQCDRCADRAEMGLEY